MATIDPARLRAALGDLLPVCDYVTRLGPEEISEPVGVGVDGRGRLRLREEPPHGRFLVFGQLWVTTTVEGDAPTDAMEGEAPTNGRVCPEHSFRFGPILEGGMDVAVYDDHVLGVCTSGSFIGGRVGANARLPAFLFRLDLDLIEDVTIRTKAKLFGGRKEAQFIALRTQFPSLAIHGETVGRIEGVGGWNDRVPGSKTTKGEVGRALALTAARHRLSAATGDHRTTLHSVLAGHWRASGEDLIANLIPDDEPSDRSDR